MPNNNGTGPQGAGPNTGWGRGPCGGGRGFFRNGFGGRFGFRRFWNSNFSNKDEKEILSNEEGMLEQEIKAIKSRLAELKGKK